MMTPLENLDAWQMRMGRSISARLDGRHWVVRATASAIVVERHTGRSMTLVRVWLEPVGTLVEQNPRALLR